MKLSRPIVTGTVVTLIAMGYVYQRVEIIKVGYSLQENRKRLDGLVDQNSKLMYNLSKLESPRTLLASLNCDQIEFANNRRRQEGCYQLARSGPEKMRPAEGLFARFLDMFTPSAEARPRK